LIPQDFISEWKKAVPWPQNDQVEQDLIICRALVEIFSHHILAENLAFRGGTALFKLHLQPVRYSEDIDLVQVHPGPIGPMLNALQEKLNPWLGNPKRKQSEGRVTLTYRVTSEEGVQLRLKVEINSREHFTVLGFVKRGFSVDSRWFSGNASILTYHLDEFLGTKVRALYQRKKGRDLFDLWAAFTTFHAQPERVIGCVSCTIWLRKDTRCLVRSLSRICTRNLAIPDSSLISNHSWLPTVVSILSWRPNSCSNGWRS